MKSTYREHQHEQGPWTIIRGEFRRGSFREIGQNSQERGRGPEGEESKIGGVDRGQNCPQAIDLRNIACDFTDSVAGGCYDYHEVHWPFQSKG